MSTRRQRGISITFGVGLLLSLLLWASVSRVGGQGLEEITPTPTPTTVPFLHPPFAGEYRITSYFDHLAPNQSWDDTIVLFNGDQASAIDGILGRTANFRGGYWFPDTTWYVYYDGHNGIDYGLPVGVTVLAAAPGEVVFAGSIPTSCGTPLQYVSLEHENGYRTYYLHLSGVCVQRGEWVEAGDPLGISGNSGCSTGPHLHFGVEREWKAADPFGWRPTDRPDPLIAYAGAPSTWLWLAKDRVAAGGAPDTAPLPPLTGVLVDPPAPVRTNGDLFLRFVPDEGSPVGETAPIARVEFFAYYAEAGSTASSWHSLGADETGDDGWTYTWDTRGVPEGKHWLHAWATGEDGRVSKGSPIRTGVTVDRQPPLGYVVGLQPGSTAGARLWLYAASYDPASTTARVTFFMRDHAPDHARDRADDEGAPPAEWREIGDARWLHTSNWALEWEPVGVSEGAQIDLVARLLDGAGNAAWTQPVEGIAIARDMPGGRVMYPASGIPVTATLDLRFLPLSLGGSAADTAPISRVAFYVWHDGDWRLVGIDSYGDDGWSMAWDPARVADQPRLRVQARVYDAQGRVNTALPQVTDLTLDRTPPNAGYLRPRQGGVARPGVELQVWAWDGGSGVDRVEFYVDDGRGWLLVGEDADARGGWTLSVPWERLNIADGPVGFSARVYDRAGNERWTDDEREVALDRAPPEGDFSFPLPGMRLSGTVTLTLAITDTVSGLDRAIFYARYTARSTAGNEDRWHHLGSDASSEDGLSLAWDTSSWAGREDVALSAWVYDRAGNVSEIPPVEGLAIGPAPAPSATPAATASAPLSSTPFSSAPLSSSPLSPTPLSPTRSFPAPSLPTPLSSTPTPLPVASSAPNATRQATSSATSVPAVPPAGTPSPLTTTAPRPQDVATSTPAIAGPSPVPRAFWYLLGAGVLVAVLLIVLAFRNLAR